MMDISSFRKNLAIDKIKRTITYLTLICLSLPSGILDILQTFITF